jgi:hypothetical protein
MHPVLKTYFLECHFPVYLARGWDYCPHLSNPDKEQLVMLQLPGFVSLGVEGLGREKREVLGGPAGPPTQPRAGSVSLAPAPAKCHLKPPTGPRLPEKALLLQHRGKWVSHFR